MTTRLRRSAIVAAVFFSVASSLSLLAQSTDGLTDAANAQIVALMRDKAARTAVQRKIDSNLIYASRLAHGQAIAPGVNSLQTGVDYDTNLRAVVDIAARVSDALLERLNQLGATVLDADFRYRNVRAEVSLDSLETIAGWSDVFFVRQKERATTAGNLAKPVMAATRAVSPILLPKLKAGFSTRAAAVRAKLEAALKARAPRPQAKEVVNVSEGRVTHRADQVVSQLGVIGSGVKVGILSDGVSSLASVQATQDLPAVTVLPGQAGSGDEGTAMLEIVHDLAPGAQLFFATAFNSITSFAQNIQDLRAAGCDIIVDDVFYFVETPFQRGQAPSVGSDTNGGIVIQAVANVTASGALYFSSAGNSGNKDDGTSGTWEGDFLSGGAVGPPIAPGETGLVHSFGATNYDPLTAAGQIINLYWSDPLGGSGNDYDLFILNAAGTTILAASTDTQNGSQDPYEEVFSGGGFPSGARVVIVQFSGTGRFLHLSTNRARLSINTPGETHGHSATPSPFAFTVAATPAAAAFGGPPNPVGPYPAPFNSGNHVELFSSDGLRRVFFNADGTAITPGNFSSTGGVVLQKPDFTAADGVSCAAPGFNPFYGTSAAAPHAGAIAALVKSAAPGFSQLQIANALNLSAIDIEGPGTDRDSGTGILDALSAVQSVGILPQAAPLLGTLTATEISGNGNGAVEPGECGGLTVQIVNGNATVDMTGVSATLTTSTPGVTIDVANATYPDIPGGGNAVNTPQFRFRLSNLVTCPLIVNFTLTVTYTGGPSPLLLTFSMRTGSPPVVSSTILDTTPPPNVPGIYTATTGLQNLRLSRNGVASTCASPHGFPGTLGAGTRRFDAYTITNCGATACVSVNLTQTSGTVNGLFSEAYLNSFDPANIATNYLADAGVSGASTSYSFTVAAGATFVVVVNEVNSGAGVGANYTLTIDGLCLPCMSFGTSPACCPTITLSPASLPNGVSGVPYPTTVITPSGGVGPYTFNPVTLPAGLTATPGPTSLTISGTPIGSFSGNITVSGTDSNGCPFSKTYPLTITCDPGTPAQATISASGTVCAFTKGNTATVTVPAAPDPPGTTYTWTITNGTITAGQGTRTITYTAGATGPIEISVNISQPGGCNFYGTTEVNVNTLCGNFFTVTPCRVLDTRTSGPALAAGSLRTFTIAGGTCGIPFAAQAVSANVAVANVGSSGFLQVFAGGNPVPTTSVINYNAGQTRTNNTIITLGPGGTISVKCNQGAGTTDLVLDLNGYFQ